jgi:hypothetical protein
MTKDCKCGKVTCPRSANACDHCYCEERATVCCQCGGDNPFTFEHPGPMPYWQPDWTYRPPVWPGNTWGPYYQPCITTDHTTACQPGCAVNHPGYVAQ